MQPASHRDCHTRTDPARTHRTTNTATNRAPYTCPIMTSALALQSQHRHHYQCIQMQASAVQRSGPRTWYEPLHSNSTCMGTSVRVLTRMARRESATVPRTGGFVTTSCSRRPGNVWPGLVGASGVGYPGAPSLRSRCCWISM